MCCSKRKTPVRIILVMSTLGVIASICMIVFTFMMNGMDILEQLEKDDDMNDLKDGREMLFKVVLTFSIFVLIISALGFVLKCVKNRCFVCTYGVCLLPIWMTVFIFGIIALIVAVASKTVIEDGCKTISEEFKTTLGKCEGIDIAANGAATNANAECAKVTISLDIYRNILINQAMCSRNCPCLAGSHSTQWTLEGLDSTYKRTEPFVWTADGHKNYDECIESTKEKPRQVGQDILWYSFAQSFAEQSDFDSIKDFIKFFEDSYDCAGICEPALFAWMRSVTEGRPSQSCIGSMKDEVTTTFMGLAASTLIAGFLLFCTFICQYCLWASYD